MSKLRSPFHVQHAQEARFLEERVRCLLEELDALYLSDDAAYPQLEQERASASVRDLALARDALRSARYAMGDFSQ